MMNILNGGAHADSNVDIQEFMILPSENAFPSLSHIFQAASKVFKALGKLLEAKHYSTGVGFEGAFCPDELSSNEEAFNLILEAISTAGFSYPDQFTLAIDAASSEYFKEGLYILPSEKGQMYSSSAWKDKLLSWLKKYPISSVEDPFEQTQWDSWTDLNLILGHKYQIVADDLTTTNTKLLQLAIDKKAANAIIIKPNQIGTLTETISTIQLAKASHFTPIVSHRAGETTDDFIADLAVGLGCPQTKFGGLNRGERIAKYNRLLAIEPELNT
jgi:enolase